MMPLGAGVGRKSACLACREAFGFHEASIVAHTCNPSTPEMEAGGWKIQSHFQWYSKFKASAGYMRLCVPLPPPHTSTMITTPKPHFQHVHLRKVFVPSKGSPVEGAILTPSICFPILSSAGGFRVFIAHEQRWGMRTLYPQEKVSSSCAFIWLKANNVATQGYWPTYSLLLGG